MWSDLWSWHRIFHEEISVQCTEELYTKIKWKQIQEVQFDLKKEEDAEDGGKANEDEGGKGETDSFQRALRDRKGEHPPLVWLDKVLQCFNI